MIAYVPPILLKVLLALCVGGIVVTGSELFRLYLAPKGVWSSDATMLLTIPVVLLVCSFSFALADKQGWTAQTHWLVKLLVYGAVGFLLFHILNFGFSCCISYWSSNGERWCFPATTDYSGSLQIDGVDLHINGVATEAGKLRQVLDTIKQFALPAVAGLFWELTLPRAS